MNDVRFWLAFAVLFVWTFGLLGYGIYALVIGDEGTALAAVVLVIVSSKVLPRPLAWLSMLGARRA